MSLKFNCSKCGSEIVVKFLRKGEFAKCYKCGAETPVPVNAIEADEEPTYETIRPRESVILKTEKADYHRYPALRILAVVYKVLAWLLLVVAIVGLVFIIIGMKIFLEEGKAYIGIGLLLFLIIISAVGFASLLAYSESINLFIDIEANARKIAESIEKNNTSGDK